MIIVNTRKDTYKNIRRTGEAFVLNDGKKINVYEIGTFHSLTQFIGSAKYRNRDYGNVFYRGQNKLYPPDKSYPSGLVPSLYRSKGSKIEKLRTKAFSYIHSSIESCKSLSDMEQEVAICLLQHYGIRTNCIDVVDNIWVAIWFAIYSFQANIIDGREHIHIKQMDETEYGYIFLILTDATKESAPGVYNGKETKLFDLRKAASSIFLRPHAQHAFMLKSKIDGFKDYNERIVGIVRFKVSDAIKWIGHDGLLSIQSLFPPTYYDMGYRYLLNEYKVNKDAINIYGSIQMISY